MAAALWRASSVGEVEGEVCRCANEGGGRGWARLRAQVAEGEVVASSTRDVGAESAARAAVTRRRRADSSGPRAERAGKAGADARKAVALTSGPARAEREEGEGGRARVMGQMGRKAEGAGDVGFFPFSFILAFVFTFSFYLLYLIQIQISHKFKLAFLSIMHQTKVKFRV
jgi:hypothetical protein